MLNLSFNKHVINITLLKKILTKKLLRVIGSFIYQNFFVKLILIVTNTDHKKADSLKLYVLLV